MNKPNILLITTDQQRFDTIQALGNGHIYTPNLNWLVDQGITFTRCYSDSPVCMPARATIMTGRHGYNHGLVANQGHVAPLAQNPTLPGVLTSMGYQTRAQGKMHFHPMRANYGFEHVELPMDYYRERNRNERDGVPKAHGVAENQIQPVISTVHETDSLTHWTAKRSIDFLETRDPTRPFFLWTSFTKPHPPYDPALNYWLLYQNKEVPPPVYGEWSRDMATMPQGLLEGTYSCTDMHRMSERQLLEMKRAYYACITQVDYTLGLIFARMRELNLLENTWIIFTADHGDMQGDHHIAAKGTFHEGSAHIPLIVRPPLGGWGRGEHTAKKCWSLVTLADIMPTALAIAEGNPFGAETKPGMDGKNLLTLINNDTEDRTFYGQCLRHFCVMDGDNKYMWTAKGGTEQMFNLMHDPEEQHDLSKSPSWQEELLPLREKLIAFCKAHAPDCIEDGKLKILPAITGPDDIEKWPGYHSTVADSDVLH